MPNELVVADNFRAVVQGTVLRPEGHPLEPVLRAWREGRSALFLSGRTLHDLVIDPVDGSMISLRELLRRTMLEHGFVYTQFSKSERFTWDDRCAAESADRKAIEDFLRFHNLLDMSRGEHEVAEAMRSIMAAARTHAGEWSDGRPLRFLFVLEFTEHLAPGSLANGSQTDDQMVTEELAHNLGLSLALRRSGHEVICVGEPGQVSHLVRSALHHVQLPQPCREEKAHFTSVALSLYERAVLEDGLTSENIASLTANTPNRTVEVAIKASHETGTPVTFNDLVEEKQKQVTRISEDTLRPISSFGGNGARLVGINTRRPMEFLNIVCAKLAARDPSTPRAVVFTGPPGTGKTVMCEEAAAISKVSAYEMLNVKGSLVGETERRVELQHQCLRQWGPSIAHVDEITEKLPMERNDFDGDNGASRAITGALLTFLADESLCGDNLVVATTNCPERIGVAMHSRLIKVPVLHPLREDFAGIVVELVRRVDPGVELDPTDTRTIEAAEIFYEKWASPRSILKALKLEQIMDSTLDYCSVVNAARNLAIESDRGSIIFADLAAVQAASSVRLMPWHDDPAGYPFPSHLQGIVDPQSGEVIAKVLNDKIAEFRRHANL